VFGHYRTCKFVKLLSRVFLLVLVIVAVFLVLVLVLEGLVSVLVGPSGGTITETKTAVIFRYCE